MSVPDRLGFDEQRIKEDDDDDFPAKTTEHEVSLRSGAQVVRALEGEAVLEVVAERARLAELEPAHVVEPQANRELGLRGSEARERQREREHSPLLEDAIS